MTHEHTAGVTSVLCLPLQNFTELLFQ